MKFSVFCSTPNSRGIHQYSLYLTRLLNRLYPTSYVIPSFSSRSFSGLITFVSQIIWEFFPGFSYYQVDVEIFSSPRLPLRAFFSSRNQPLRGVVLHDFIQYLQSYSPRYLLRLCINAGIIEFSKYCVHTLLSFLSLKRVDFVVINSSFTADCFLHRLPNEARRLSAHSLVLHPAPSFSRDAVLDALHSLPSCDTSRPVTLHIVTGSSPSKNTPLLEACLSSLKEKLANYESNFIVHIFGYDSKPLSCLSTSDFSIHCHPKSVSETVLIHSYLCSDIFLSTSVQEGFGIPLLDSILFNLCCIATPIDPFLEIARQYSSSTNDVCFASSFDISVADEMATLIIHACRSLVSRSPKEKAYSYIEASESIFADAQHKLSMFLEQQMAGGVR